MKRSLKPLGVLLITIGVIYLLLVFGLINIHIFETLALLWPLFIIGIGVNIAFKKWQGVRHIAWLSILAIFAFVSIFGEELNLYDKTRFSLNQVEAIDIEQLESRYFEATEQSEGQLNTNKLGGTVSISATDDYDLIAQSNGEISDKISDNAHIFIAEGAPDIDNGVSSYASYQLSSAKRWDIAIEALDLSLDIDATQLKIDSLDIGSFEGDYTITVANLRDMKIDIDAFSSQLVVNVPKGMGYQIDCDSLSANIEINGEVIEGNEYQSNDYHTTTNQLYISIDALETYVIINEF